MTTMQTTPQAVDVIKAFEGFRPEPYYDSAGVITIGYGTARTYKDGHPIQLGDQIDEPSAELELVGHVRENVEPAMARIFSGVPLTFPQRDALASFVYNLGGGNPKKYETLGKLVKGAPTRCRDYGPAGQVSAGGWQAAAWPLSSPVG